MDLPNVGTENVFYIQDASIWLDANVLESYTDWSCITRKCDAPDNAFMHDVSDKAFMQRTNRDSPLTMATNVQEYNARPCVLLMTACHRSPSTQSPTSIFRPHASSAALDPTPNAIPPTFNMTSPYTFDLVEPGHITRFERDTVPELRMKLTDRKMSVSGMKGTLLAKLTLSDLGLKPAHMAATKLSEMASLWATNNKDLVTKLETLGLQARGVKRDFIGQLTLHICGGKLPAIPAADITMTQTLPCPKAVAGNVEKEDHNDVSKDISSVPADFDFLCDSTTGILEQAEKFISAHCHKKARGGLE